MTFSWLKKLKFIKRPSLLGVVIVLFLFNGVFGLFNSFKKFIMPINFPMADHHVGHLITNIVINLVWVAVGVGLIKKHNWARLTSGIFLVLAFVISIVFMVLANKEFINVVNMSNQTTKGLGNTIIMLLAVFLMFIASLAYYMLFKLKKEQFKTRKQLREQREIKRQLKLEKRIQKHQEFIEIQKQKENFVPDEI